MEMNGCMPNSCTYNVFVQGLLTKKETTRSLKYLTMMRDKGFSVDATTTEMIINYLSTNEGDNGFREFLFSK
jgi:pentatricopeptide repeat protein